MAYDNSLNYADLINKAVASGDTAAAQKYELARNEKVADMTRNGGNNAGYTPTFNYGTDYATLINNASASGDNAAAGTYEYLRNQKVDTMGGNYQKTYNYIDKNGNSKKGVTQNTMDYYDQLLEKLNSQYQNSLSMNNASYTAQLQQQMADIENQKRTLNQSYDNAAKQLYIQRRMSEKNTPQALAAMGYNGGLAESSLLDIQNQYQENLLNNEQNRTQGLSDLEYQRINGQSENAIAQAQARQSAEDNYYSNYASLLAQIMAQKNYESEQATQQEQYNQSLALQQAELAAEIEKNRLAAAKKSTGTGTVYATQQPTNTGGSLGTDSNVYKAIMNKIDDGLYSQAQSIYNNYAGQLSSDAVAKIKKALS